MISFNREKFEEAYKKAPEAVREISISAKTMEKLQLIYARHEVEKQAFYISSVIGYALVGLLPIKKFIPALQEDAGLDPEIAKRVAYDVRAQIFSHVAQDLAKLQFKANLESEAEEAEAKENIEKKEPPRKPAFKSTVEKEIFPKPKEEKEIPSENIVDLSNKLR